MKTLLILVGIPCSGKSSWVKRIWDGHTAVISRDNIRELDCFDKPYVYSTENENRVTAIHEDLVEDYLKDPWFTLVILDNTHCKEKYIDQIVFDEWYKERSIAIQIKFFDTPLWLACIRNIGRHLKSGKWIPWKVMFAMKRNYDKINRKKYEQYIFC